MSLALPNASATGALLRIPFTLVDATDLVTPENITVTGVKVTLSIAGGTPAASTNDIVKVNGTNGEYYIELTTAEATAAAGSVVRGYLTPSGCALTKIQAQIGTVGLFAATVDANVTTIAAGAITATSIADGALTAAKFAAGAFAAVWASLTSGLTTSGSIGKLLVDQVTALLTTGLTAIKAATDQLAFTSGKVNAQVKGLDANTVNAAALAADAVTEISDAIEIVADGGEPDPDITRVTH